MKLEGEIVSMEYLRGGAVANVSLGPHGKLTLTKLSDEEAKAMHAGFKVEVSVELLPEAGPEGTEPEEHLDSFL